MPGEAFTGASTTRASPTIAERRAASLNLATAACASLRFSSRCDLNVPGGNAEHIHHTRQDRFVAEGNPGEVRIKRSRYRKNGKWRREVPDMRQPGY